MNLFEVHVNTGVRNYVTSVYADSPKDAAIICCARIAVNNNIEITKDKLSKGINSKTFTGDWSSWCGSLIEVKNYKTGKVYTYNLIYDIDKA